MQIIYIFLGAVCVLLPICGLLTEKLKIWQYVLLAVYITLMGILSPRIGRIAGILMFAGLLIFLSLILRKNKLENLCLACLIYMFNIFFNNVMILIASFFSGVSVNVIEREYYLLFSIVYCIILLSTVKMIRFLVYEKMHLMLYLERLSFTVKYSLLINLFIYIVLFVINVFWGNHVEYSNNVLWFNCFLFFLCAFVSCYLIIVCTKQARMEEARDAEIKKRQLLEDYIACLENMMEDAREFKHNYKNMLSTMAGYMHENKMEELQLYFDKQLQRPSYSKLDEMQTWQQLKNIQTMEIKGLLFEKVLSALGKGIRVQVEIAENIDVKFEKLDDLIRILGIFIDNAIEEVEKRKGLIGIVIAKTDDRLLFQIKNEYENQPDMSKLFCKGYSTKGEDRGVGLYVVRSLLQDHDDIAHECRVEKGIFIQKIEIST